MLSRRMRFRENKMRKTNFAEVKTTLGALQTFDFVDSITLHSFGLICIVNVCVRKLLVSLFFSVSFDLVCFYVSNLRRKNRVFDFSFIFVFLFIGCGSDFSEYDVLLDPKINQKSGSNHVGL